MKLAEALILRADCQKRIAQLKSRLLTNAKVQEGDKPTETPQELIVELGRVSNELLDLIKRINRTNSATVFAGRGTISDALAERDVLALQRAAYAELAQTAAISQGRFTRSEVKYISTINVAEIQKRADELAKNCRDLDARIQELNWQTELGELSNQSVVGEKRRRAQPANWGRLGLRLINAFGRREGQRHGFESQMTSNAQQSH